MKPSSAHPRHKLLLLILIILIAIALAALGWFGWQWMQAKDDNPPEPPVAETGQETVIAPQAVTSTPTQTPTGTAVPILLDNSGTPEENLDAQGVMILAMRDGLYIHLFAYHPLYLPLTRLTNTPWDDITPTVSLDGKRLSFSSRANGYWDLYTIDLETGERTRLTDTPEYEASPTFSPDGLWIAYERFDGSNLDIFISQLTGGVVREDSQTIQLTDDPGIDRSPVWDPQGRRIAFSSTRSGDEEIWLAQLDEIDNRFVNISQNPQARDRYPVWAEDGSRLAWATEKNGDRRLSVWDVNDEIPPFPLGEGDMPVWSPDGSLLFTTVRSANASDLTAYQIANGRLSMPLTSLPGEVYGLTWVRGPLPAWLKQTIQQGDQSPAPALINPTITLLPASSIGRYSVIPLEDVTAPHPQLHDEVDDAFNQLRYQVGIEAGWDALSSLENAFVPLTTPPDPTAEADWLYTGRAFTLNPLLLSAGWMAIAREDFGGQTYWHIYLKARYQDGSMGMPMPDMVWDLNARYASDPKSYENGGKLAQAPEGYWIDFTELASRYGWERLPSLTNWRSFYPSIRFNLLVMSGGLDWYSAMAQIYPPEALVTATPQPTATREPTGTRESASAQNQPRPTITPIPTRRPTWTPFPTQ